MKISTVNFWSGVIIGFGIAKFGRKWYADIKKGVKKLLGIASPSEETTDIMKEQLDAIDTADAGGGINSSRSGINKESLSKLLDATKYRSNENSAPDNVVKFGVKSGYIVIDEIKAGKIPDKNSEDTNSKDE